MYMYICVFILYQDKLDDKEVFLENYETQK